MIAQHQEQRSRTAELAEVVPLRQVLPGGVLPIVVLLAHERVAQVDVEIGGVGQGIGQRPLIEFGADAIVEVRVGRDGEREGAIPRALRLEGGLRAVGAAGTELVEILRVGLQIADQHFDRFAFLELPRCAFVA